MKEKLYSGFTKHKIQDAVEDFIQDANELGLEYILIAQKKKDKFVDCNVKMSAMDVLAHISALIAMFDDENGITTDEAIDFVTKAVKGFETRSDDENADCFKRKR